MPVVGIFSPAARVFFATESLSSSSRRSSSSSAATTTTTSSSSSRMTMNSGRRASTSRRNEALTTRIFSSSSSSSSQQHQQVEPSDAPGEGKRRFPAVGEESARPRAEPRKYKHPHNEGCAVTYSFDTDAFGKFRVVEICDEQGNVLPMDAPGEAKRRGPDPSQEREKDDGWDTKKGHGLMFGYVEERNPDNAC